MNLISRFLTRAGEAPDRLALVESHRGRDRTMTYQELDDASARAAGVFRAMGLEPGAPVLVFVPMSIDLYSVLLGLFRCGAVPTFIDPTADARTFESACQRVKPQAFVAVSKAHWFRLRYRAVRGISRRFHLGWPVPWSHSWRSAMRNGSAMSSVENLSASAPALITFTSGSTGLPKAVVRTHGLLLAQHDALIECLQLQAGEVDLTTLPIFVLANLGSGLTSVLPEAGEDAAPRIRAQMERHQPSRTVAAPAFLERLMASAPLSPEPSPLRRIDTGGGPLFPDYLGRLRRHFSEAEIHLVYGSSEAEPMASMPCTAALIDEIATRGALPGGVAGKTVDLRVIADRWGEPLGELTAVAWKARQLPCGEIGEIVVTGPHVVPAYLDGIGDEACKFAVERQRWHRTGDAGYFDAEGRLWLVGRCEGRARAGAENSVIYPLQVELPMRAFEGVAAAALVEVEKVGWLAYTTENNAEPAEILLERIRGLAESFGLCPIRLESLPLDRRHRSKIDYTALRAVISHRQSG